MSRPFSYQAYAVVLTCLVLCSTASQDVTISECNFENGLCDFSQDEHDDFDWTLNKGNTPSGATGPSHDHTYGESGEGTYAYVEASSPQAEGDRARLLSPVVLVKDEEQYTVTFYNHMHGIAMGQMNVYVRDVTNKSEEMIWSKEGREMITYGDHWLLVELDVNATRSFQVVFEGVVGSSFLSDMAVDDVRISRKINQSAGTETSTSVMSLMTTLSLLATIEEDNRTTSGADDSVLSSVLFETPADNQSPKSVLTHVQVSTTEKDNITTDIVQGTSDVASSSVEITTNQQPPPETTGTSPMMTTESDDVSTTEGVHQTGLPANISSETITANQQATAGADMSPSMETTENGDVTTVEISHKSALSRVISSDYMTTNQQASTEEWTSSSALNTENDGVTSTEGVHQTESAGSTSSSAATTNHQTSKEGLLTSSLIETTETSVIATDDVIISTSEAASSGTFWPDTTVPQKSNSLSTSHQTNEDATSETTSVSELKFTSQGTAETDVLDDDGGTLVGSRTNLIVITCVALGSLIAFCVILGVFIFTVHHCKHKTDKRTFTSDCKTNHRGVDNAAFSNNYIIEEETFPTKTKGQKYAASNGKIQLSRLDDTQLNIDQNNHNDTMLRNPSQAF